ncbi:hypothetical protein C8R46DRAFT_1192699 [Mycena filopes]|nr:hypothetical protein C8R46DRAFT_1192699 [Mycena filopes]
MFSWKWIQPQSADPSFDPPAAAGHSFDLPDEIWALIFHEACLRERDLYSLSLSCRHFNTLALPVLLYDFTDTSPSSLAAGKITMNSNLVPALTMAIQLPFIQRLSLTFDIHGDSKAPGELLALRALVGRLPSLVDLWLNFPRDLLSAYKSDLTPLTPQRAMTESFCDLLSAIPSTPNDPVVFVGTEVFTSRAEDIRGWQLDKYMFTEPPTGTGGGRLLSLLSYIRPQAVKNPLRTKTSVKQHNGLYASAFPFISISSVHIQRLPGPFSAGISGWTLVVLNAGSSHWPPALNLSAPLAAEEWGAILPLLAFPKLPLIRMDRPREGAGILPNVPAPVLDAFLARHPTLSRMYYYPDPLTLPLPFPPLDSDPVRFPYASLPRMRNITTTARGALHLFRAPEHAFPSLFIVCISISPDDDFGGRTMTAALRLLARHGGANKLILEVASGAWMDSPHFGEADAEVVRALHRVDTVILSGFTDFVRPEAILGWVGLFPALRRVGLQGCLHHGVGVEEKREFVGRVGAGLGAGVELISSES